MGEDGHGGRIMVSNGIPEGPVVRGGWGSLWGWSKETMSYSVCIRPARPPQRNAVRAQEEPSCIHGHLGRYRKTGPSGKSYCSRCVTERSRERRQAA
jgi:hypothetical protein